MSKLAALRWTDRWVTLPSLNSDESDQGKLSGKELLCDEMVEATSQMDISLTYALQFIPPSVLPYLLYIHHQSSSCQWPFQDPKLEVPTICKAYVRPM